MSESPLRTIVMALAIVIAGLLIAGGIQRFRIADRYVTVKGVAERDVQADIGIWPLRFTAASNDLGVARQKIETDRKNVVDFLVRHGIEAGGIQLQRYEVTDDQANPYRGGNPSPNRFIVSMTLVARSNEPQKIAAASQAVGELIAANVVLQSADYSGGPTYVFTKLNDVKPAMLAEATRNAREAAGEFAKESKTQVGSIRRASQGVFEILPRDPAPGIAEGAQIEKTLRVVATMDYYLK
jgi:hypothetical protein